VAEEVRLETPWGEPSDAYRVGDLSGVPIAVLLRHGPGHRIPPQALNNRANVWGFKKLGCDALLSTREGGSMKESVRPSDVVIPAQFVDLARSKASSFFDEGAVAEVSMARPFCPHLGALIEMSARGLGGDLGIHPRGTLLSIDGPHSSSRAESILYRSWGVDVIGTTLAAEARLSREAEICYASAVLVTGFDSWRDEEAPAAVEAVIAVLKANARSAVGILSEAARRVDPCRACGCRNALGSALVTLPSDVPPPVRDRLALLTEKYWT
jgi:5'-methylthioadenosine phosphorylase